jgi:hypothetical protein
LGAALAERELGMTALLNRFRGAMCWAGLFAGGFAWYGAHDLSLYLVRQNCTTSHVIAPLIHLVALAIALGGGLISYREIRAGGAGNHAYSFAASVGFAAALLLSVVILWQGVATLVYTGCER